MYVTADVDVDVAHRGRELRLTTLYSHYPNSPIGSVGLGLPVATLNFFLHAVEGRNARRDSPLFFVSFLSAL